MSRRRCHKKLICYLLMLIQVWLFPLHRSTWSERETYGNRLDETLLEGN